MKRGLLARRRLWNVVSRTLHLTGFGLLLGGSAYDVDPARMTRALILTITTGALLVMLELWQDPRWPFLGKGLFVLAKLVLLLLVPVFPSARVPLLVAIVVVAGVGAHMPREFRHYSLIERRVVSYEESAACR